MKDKCKTRVIFKTHPLWADKDVIAFLLDVPAYSGFVMSYMHIGQHGDASLGFFKECKLVKNYEALKEELESIGYELTICKR